MENDKDRENEDKRRGSQGSTAARLKTEKVSKSNKE